MIEYWVAIILALIAASPGVFAFLNQRKRLKSEVGKTKTNNVIRVIGEIWEISEEYKGRVKLLEEKIEKLERELEDTNEEMGGMRIGIARLLAQLIEHDVVPVWSPVPEVDEVHP